MTEPNEQDVQRFREAVDNRLSGLRADPALAKKIIQAEKGEKKVKKFSARLVLVMALVCAAVFALAEGWPRINELTAPQDLIKESVPRTASQDIQATVQPAKAEGDAEQQPEFTPIPTMMPTPLPVILAEEMVSPELMAVMSPVPTIMPLSTPEPIRQTAELHRWLLEKSVANALKIRRLAADDIYLNGVDVTAKQEGRINALLQEDFSQPKAMYVYALDWETLEALWDMPLQVDDFARAEITRRAMRRWGLQGIEEAEDAYVFLSALEVASAYQQPQGLSDVLVVLTFAGDYPIACGYTVYPDGTVICISGPLVNDLPSLFTCVAAYEGLALELIGGSAPKPTYAPLKLGSVGELVEDMQARLKELGYYTGEEDGDYDSATFEAVKAFQQRNGLVADGLAGEATLKTLFEGDGLSPAATPMPAEP